MQPRTDDDRAWRGHPIVLFALICLPAATMLFTAKGIVDDAYITFRYSWNFAHGNGLVFNAGERVEGYTNFLWMALSALAYPLHAPIEDFAFGLAALCALGAGAMVYGVARAEGAPRWAAYLGMIALAGCVDYWRSISFALEGGLLSLVLMLVFHALQKRNGKLAGLGAGCLFLIRPEFVTFLPIHLIARFLAWAAGRRARDNRGGRRTLAWSAGGWLAVVLGMTVFRRLYFHAWLPNTMTAKAVDLSNRNDLHTNLHFGWSYIQGFALGWPGLTVGLLLGALVALARRNATLVTYIGAMLFECLVVLINGGDWMDNFRLLSVFAPVMAVFLAVALDGVGRLGGSAGLPAAYALGGLAFGATIYGLHASPYLLNRPQFAATSNEGCYSVVIPALKPAVLPGDRLSLDALGLASYSFIHNYAYDMWGLTDRETALHGRYGRQLGRSMPSYDFEVIRPDIVIAHGSTWYLEQMEAASQSRYSALYDTYELKGIPTCGYSKMYVSFKKNKADRLLPAIEALNPVPAALGPH